MADHDYFSHTSPVTGDTAFSLLDHYGVGYGWAGENLAKNNYPLDQCEGIADDALWNSPPHRENILNTHYTQARRRLRRGRERHGLLHRHLHRARLTYSLPAGRAAGYDRSASPRSPPASASFRYR